MADNRNLCEEIEIAIYSDAELTQEQKNHIESCENCRALLSQVTKMKNDLGALCVPGIEDGEICNRVMKQIEEQKRAVSFPGFRFAHHIGTAAAVVIILVAALMIKNPSEDGFNKSDIEDNAEKIVFEQKSNNHVITGGGSADDYSDVADGEAVLRSSPLPEAESDNTSAVNDTMLPSNPSYDYKYSAADGESTSPYNPKAEDTAENGESSENGTSEKMLMFKATAPTANAALTASDENEDALLYDSDTGITESEKNDALLTEVYTDSLDISEAVTEEAAEEEYDGAVMYATGSSGGGGAANTATTTSQNGRYVFEGVEFLKGEENFAHNVEAANARLHELFGDRYTISVRKLEKLGVTNKKLLEIAPTVTFETFDFYKNILDIFE